MKRHEIAPMLSKRMCKAAVLVAIAVLVSPLAGQQPQQRNPNALVRPSSAAQVAKPKVDKRPKVVKTDAAWRRQLSRKQFLVTRRGDTEAARSGRYYRHKVKGTYHCICCDEPVFPSATKFDSGTGWPSFFAPYKKEHVATRIDRKLSNPRMEVICSRCDAHLGHVFNDGPRPTGLRYCLNSAALKFHSKADQEKAAREKAAAAAVPPTVSDEDSEPDSGNSETLESESPPSDSAE